ncbi:MAG TPA: NAD(P)-binding domain-containing protein, partial [Casimicrobiaceae bacterium]|nr:NAD(P)-binding domain-containing protein [Casimicrobiaceae bacterium]
MVVDVAACRAVRPRRAALHEHDRSRGRQGGVMEPATRRVALIGLGLVGEALARRLVAARFEVIGWDVAAARRDALRAHGVAMAASALDAVRGVGHVVLALPDTRALVAVLEDILPALERDSIVIDTGTNDPDRVVEWAARLAQRGVSLLDVPLSGSSEQIGKGEAVAMGGGEKRAWDAAATLIAAITPN